MRFIFGDKSLSLKVRFGKSKERINVEYYVTQEEFNRLRSENKSINEIANLVGFPSSGLTLQKYAKQLGWDMGKKVYGNNAKISVNEDFFKTWTPDSAWVYGWLLTDGSIDESSGHIKLALKQDDKPLLQKIKSVMSFEGNIYDGGHKDGRKYSCLTICRKSMAEDLFRLGMARKNKTFNTSMPNVPDDLFWDFMRGVVEGDGNIAHRTGNTDAMCVTITGATRQFMVDLQEKLLEHGVATHIYTREAHSVSGNKAEMYSLFTKSNADALRMCFFMYANTPRSRRLDRKFAVYENYVKTYYDHVHRRSIPCIELVELSRQFIAA